jgi:ABC-type uncharacterized transport system ATPase subunit
MMVRLSLIKLILFNRRPGFNGTGRSNVWWFSKGELAVILAPFGVGKTTMMTKIGNTAVSDGKVLQIFFEDNKSYTKKTFSVGLVTI